MYTIDFNSVPLSSTPESYTFTSGPFTVTLRDVVTIGPGNPAYLGQVGILATGGEYGVEVTMTDGEPIELFSGESVEFGLGSATSEYGAWNPIFQGTTGFGRPVPGTEYLGRYPPGIEYYEADYGPGHPGYAGTLHAIWIGSDPTGPAVLSGLQLGGILIWVVPEPSTALPAAIAGLIGLGFAWHRRKARAIA